MAGELGILVGVAHSLLFLTYVCGVLMQTLPIPRPSWKAWGPVMMWDALIGELALATLSIIQLGADSLTNLLGETFVGPFSSATASYALIMAQLIPIDVAIFTLTSAVSATVVFAPVAELLARMLGPAASWVTGAIILWSALMLVINLFPKIWLIIYTLGTVFWAIPFRLGRQVATYFMSSSIVFAIGLPPMPYIALWLQGYIGYEGFLKPLQDAAAQVQANPLTNVFAAGQFMAALPSALGNLIASIIISLIVFPIVYLFILATITRSLAKAIGGSAGGPMLDRFVLT